jgi:hypothetical protein
MVILERRTVQASEESTELMLKKISLLSPTLFVVVCLGILLKEKTSRMKANKSILSS